AAVPGPARARLQTVGDAAQHAGGEPGEEAGLVAQGAHTAVDLFAGEFGERAAELAHRLLHLAADRGAARAAVLGQIAQRGAHAPAGRLRRLGEDVEKARLQPAELVEPGLERLARELAAAPE